MSYDINFWKQERTLDFTPEEIYGKLCKRESVDGLAKLPVEEILKKLREAFPEFDPIDKIDTVRTTEGSIEFSWSDQHFRFDIRGICGDCQKLVDVMAEFDCPMYDPQLNKRHDAQGGMAVGETEKFEDTPPEQKAELERIKREFLAKRSGTSEKKGCGAVAMLLLTGTVVTGIVVWRILG